MQVIPKSMPTTKLGFQPSISGGVFQSVNGDSKSAVRLKECRSSMMRCDTLSAICLVKRAMERASQKVRLLVEKGVSVTAPPCRFIEGTNGHRNQPNASHGEQAPVLGASD